MSHTTHSSQLSPGTERSLGSVSNCIDQPWEIGPSMDAALESAKKQGLKGVCG